MIFARFRQKFSWSKVKKLRNQDHRNLDVKKSSLFHSQINVAKIHTQALVIKDQIPTISLMDVLAFVITTFLEQLNTLKSRTT